MRASFRLVARLCVLVATLVWLLAPAAASAETDEEGRPRIYKWVDANGIAHYTTDRDRIPRALRNRIGRSEPREAAPAPAPAPRAAAPVPPEPGADVPTSDVRPGFGAPPAGSPGAPPRAPAPAGRAFGTPEAWVMRDATPRPPAGSGRVIDGSASPAPDTPELAAERATLDSQIADLEAAIRADEAKLKRLISDPEIEIEQPLYDQPEFLEISRRLPQLQASLEQLRSQREALGTP